MPLYMKMSQNINKTILTNLLRTDNETKSVKNRSIKKDKKDKE